LAKALGRIVISYKEIQELAGYTTLVSELKDVIDQLKGGYYNRHFPTVPKNIQLKEKVTSTNERLKPIKNGEIEISDCIMMDDVPLLAPNGDELATNISLLIKPGMSC